MRGGEATRFGADVIASGARQPHQRANLIKRETKLPRPPDERSRATSSVS